MEKLDEWKERHECVVKGMLTLSRSLRGFTLSSLYGVNVDLDHCNESESPQRPFGWWWLQDLEVKYWRVHGSSCNSFLPVPAFCRWECWRFLGQCWAPVWGTVSAVKALLCWLASRRIESREGESTGRRSVVSAGIYTALGEEGWLQFG